VEQTRFFLMKSSTCVFQSIFETGTKLEQRHKNWNKTPKKLINYVINHVKTFQAIPPMGGKCR